MSHATDRTYMWTTEIAMGNNIQLCDDEIGSPKRRPFQRQRAASETTDHTEDEALSLQDEVIESLPDTPIQSSGLQSLSAESLSQHTSATTSSVFLSR